MLGMRRKLRSTFFRSEFLDVIPSPPADNVTTRVSVRVFVEDDNACMDWLFVDPRGISGPEVMDVKQLERDFFRNQIFKGWFPLVTKS